MASVNEHVKAELDRFRKQTGEVFYGLQIDAPWGSGKTRFIKDYIKANYPVAAGESTKCLIISLFGVKSVQDIEQKIAGQLFSGPERLAGAIFSTLATGVSGFFKFEKAATTTLDKSAAAVLSNRLKDLKDGLLVFDDVERCSMPLKDALGYINRFIEDEKFKVVLISNEAALSRPDASSEEKANDAALRAFKEKLIGRTLRLSADPEVAYSVFADGMTTQKAKEVAIAERLHALSLFKSSKHENLRSLRLGLEAFNRLLAEFKDDLPVKSDGLRDILLSCLYVALEYGAAVNYSTIADPHAGRLSRMMEGIGNGGKSTPPSENEKVAASILDRYGDKINFRSATVPLELLLDFIVKGILDIQSVESALRISPLMNDAKEVPVWRRLIEIWSYDSNALKDDTKIALEKFDKLEFRDPGELLHLGGIMLWRESYGDLSLSEGQNPVDYIRSYLKKLVQEEEQLDLNQRQFTFDRLSAYGYVALCPDDMRSALIEISNLITASINETARSNFPRVVDKIFEALSSDARNLDKLYDDDISPYARMPFLADSDPNRFVDFILRNNQFDHEALKFISDRYAHYVDAEVKAAEQPWLDTVYGTLKEKIENEAPPLDKWWLSILNEKIQQFASKPAVSSIVASKISDE